MKCHHGPLSVGHGINDRFRIVEGHNRVARESGGNPTIPFHRPDGIPRKIPRIGAHQNGLLFRVQVVVPYVNYMQRELSQLVQLPIKNIFRSPRRSPRPVHRP